jgi:CelD/BcsL family acetyltransferase involved in cellulose biosynthesis
MRTNVGLSTEVVRDIDGLLAIRTAWDRLYEQGTRQANPFLRWIWVWHWWSCVSRRRGQPRATLHILVMRDAREVRGIVPFFLGQWGVGPLTIRVLRQFGFRVAPIDLRTPLVWAGWERQVAASLSIALEDQRDHYDLCVLDGLPECSPLTQWLASRVGRAGWRWGEPVDSAVLPLPHSWEDLHASLSHNNRRSVQQGRKALQRDGRRYAFEIVSRPDEVPAAVQEFFMVHAARAAERTGLRHPDYYSHAEDRAFLRALSQELANDGLLRVCRLRVDGQVVACRLVLAAGDGLYLYHAGHDPAWGRYRVGTTLTAECLRMGIRAGARFADLGTGSEESKLRWRPKVQKLYRLHVVSPTLRGRIVGGATERAIPLFRRRAVVQHSRLASACTVPARYPPPPSSESS